MLVIFANPVLKKTQTDPTLCSFQTTGLVYEIFIKEIAFFVRESENKSFECQIKQSWLDRFRKLSPLVLSVYLKANISWSDLAKLNILHPDDEKQNYTS